MICLHGLRPTCQRYYVCFIEKPEMALLSQIVSVLHTRLFRQVTEQCIKICPLGYLMHILLQATSCKVKLSLLNQTVLSYQSLCCGKESQEFGLEVESLQVDSRYDFLLACVPSLKTSFFRPSLFCWTTFENWRDQRSIQEVGKERRRKNPQLKGFSGFPKFKIVMTSIVCFSNDIPQKTVVNT